MKFKKSGAHTSASMARFAAAIAMCFAAAAPSLAQAQATDWPTRPVTMINPFAAGSAVDVVARLVAQKMTTNLGVAFNVDVRTGASGNIGTDQAARAKPDGYTLLIGSPGTMAINPYLFPKLPYDAIKDFVPITELVAFPQVVLVGPKQSIKTLPELIAAAKAHPGVVTHGSSGQGSTSHLAMELIKAQAGITMNHISYRGGAPAVLAVASGEIVSGVEGIPSLMGQINGGSVIAIAVTSPKRSPLLPNVPAVAEYFPGFDASAWIILMAPAGTPPAIVAKISAEAKKAMEDPAVKAQLEAQGTTVVGSTPAEAAAFQVREMAKFKKVVESSGAKAEQ